MPVLSFRKLWVKKKAENAYKTKKKKYNHTQIPNQQLFKMYWRIRATFRLAASPSHTVPWSYHWHWVGRFHQRSTGKTDSSGRRRSPICSPGSAGSCLCLARSLTSQGYTMQDAVYQCKGPQKLASASGSLCGLKGSKDGERSLCCPGSRKRMSI